MKKDFLDDIIAINRKLNSQIDMTAMCILCEVELNHCGVKCEYRENGGLYCPAFCQMQIEFEIIKKKVRENFARFQKSSTSSDWYSTNFHEMNEQHKKEHPEQLRFFSQLKPTWERKEGDLEWESGKIRNPVKSVTPSEDATEAEKRLSSTGFVWEDAEEYFTVENEEV